MGLRQLTGSVVTRTIAALLHLLLPDIFLIWIAVGGLP